MQLIWQIANGTLFLSLCAAVHLGLIIISMPFLDRVAQSGTSRFRIRRASVLIGLAFTLTVIGHSLQVWIWALALLEYGAFDRLEASIYFALASYTTLGYGDIVLAEDLRIFGAFTSVSGMLTFGVSTAFLVGMIGRVLPKGIH